MTEPGRPVTIVTGAAGGIGSGIVAVLKERGHQVVGFDIVAADGVRVVDIGDSAAVDAAVSQVVDDYGRIDGLVNNAAVGPLGTVLDTADETLDHILAVNVKGAFAVARAVLRFMVPARTGSIVNIGSGAGHGKANMAAYAASKAAVHALSASMAYDHFADHVRVNTVIPGGGGIPTGISLGRFGGSAAEVCRAFAPGLGSRSTGRSHRRRQRCGLPAQRRCRRRLRHGCRRRVHGRSGRPAPGGPATSR